MSVLSRVFRVAGPRRIAKLTLVAVIFAAAGVALARVRVRVETTQIGYDIAQLKTDEAKLLEERSLLRMQLAKLTTKKHLLLMSEGEEARKESKPKVAAN